MPLCLKEMERDQYLEMIRNEKFDHTLNTIRELDYSEDPEKLKQLFMYKIRMEDDYCEEQRIIKQEFRDGIMDPSRHAAKVEKNSSKSKQK